MADGADFTCELEELRAELRQKDEDLILAARYGKALLEDNTSLKQRLAASSERCGNLEADVQAQRLESQRLRASSEKVAASHMSDLEQQLDTLKQELDSERSNFTTAMEERKRERCDLRAENRHLKEQLEKASENSGPLLSRSGGDDEQRRELCEDEKHKLRTENEQLQNKVLKLQDSCKNYSQEVSTLAHTCDRLSDDLVSCRGNCSEWEHEVLSKEEELALRLRDLQEAQEFSRKIQAQFDEHQNSLMMTPNSTTSGLSLFEELTVSHKSFTIPDDSCSDTSETSLSDTASCERPTTICKVMSSGGRSSSPAVPTPGWSEECECLRCSELERKLSERIKELQHANDQLLAAVAQKFELQQQVEAWQVSQIWTCFSRNKSCLNSKRTASQKKKLQF